LASKKYSGNVLAKNKRSGYNEKGGERRLPRTRRKKNTLPNKQVER